MRIKKLARVLRVISAEERRDFQRLLEEAKFVVNEMNAGRLDEETAGNLLTKKGWKRVNKEES